MPKIEEILNWNFNSSDFKNSGNRVITTETKQQINIFIHRLRDLSEKLPVDNKLPEKRLLNDVYWHFKNNKDKEQSDLLSIFSKRDVRILVWALDYRNSEDDQIILFSNDFDTALKIILSKWKDSFIIHLWHLLLQNWITLQNYKPQYNTVNRILSYKCGEYTKTRKDIISIKNNFDLFYQYQSHIEYAKELIENNILFGNAHNLINQKDSILTYEYFSLVIESYVQLLKDINNDHILSIFDFIAKHNSKKTTLIVCSALINDDKYKRFIETIKTNAVCLIGDPIKLPLWRISGLSIDQEIQIEKARIKLNMLLNKHFITVFFEKLVQDERRKKYWLKFVDKIYDIKFIGNKANYYFLKRIDSLTDYVDSRYKVTKQNQSTCALVIYSKEYVFVEFTDTGALYIYKQNNFKVNLRSIAKMEDLKTWTRYDFACCNSYSYGYIDLKDEGRITHQGFWESRVDAWMKKYFDNSEVKVHGFTVDDFNQDQEIALSNNVNKEKIENDYNKSVILQDDCKSIKKEASVEAEKVPNYYVPEINKGNFIEKPSAKFENLKKLVLALNKLNSYKKIKESNISYPNHSFQKAIETTSTKNDGDTIWESPTLLWSKNELPGYKYSRNKKAWWKYKFSINQGRNYD